MLSFLLTLAFALPCFAQKTAVSYDGKIRLSSPVVAVNSRPSKAFKCNIEGENGIFVMTLSGKGFVTKSLTDSIGLFFAEIPSFKEGVSLWRFAPHKAWTKPIAIASVSDLQSDDIQCFYWHYKDGVYAVAVPLCGNGFSTSLGQFDGKFGSKAVVGVKGHSCEQVPAMVVGFGKDIYNLFHEVYATALAKMDRSENLIDKKSLPDIFNYIGWCTYNALDGDRNQSEQTILYGAKAFAEAGYNLGYVLIDGSWPNYQKRGTLDIYPRPDRYPNGFRYLVSEIKRIAGVRSVGLWQGLNMHWNGISTNGALWERYGKECFSWKQRFTPTTKDTTMYVCNYFRPDSRALADAWDKFHSFLRDSGFDMIKVDNQCCVGKMATGNYPVFDLASEIHKVVNKSAFKYFGGTMINCMGMTADAYYNYGSTAVARNSQDYFPYSPSETYDLERGNAAAHVLQCFYNSLYFSQMVYTDMDMFQTHNPNGEFHALARVLNNGPIYFTDVPGQSDFAILDKMTLSDGYLLKADTPALPCEECLFQVQEPRPFKVFSYSGDTGLLGVFNMADSDKLSGYVSPEDVNGLSGKKFAVYEHFTGDFAVCKSGDRIPVSLDRMGYRCYYVSNFDDGVAVFGLVDKYNGPAAIRDYHHEGRKVSLILPESGKFACALKNKPFKFTVNGKPAPFEYAENGLLTADVKGMPECRISIVLSK